MGSFVEEGREEDGKDRGKRRLDVGMERKVEGRKGYRLDLHVEQGRRRRNAFYNNSAFPMDMMEKKERGEKNVPNRSTLWLWERNQIWR